MKILMVIPSLAKGGAERVVSLLSQEWAKQHQVQIALFNAHGQAYPVNGEVFDLNVAAQRNVLTRITNPLVRVFRLASLFKRERPDLIVTFMESANLPSVLAAMVTGMTERVVVSVHNNPDYFPVCHRWLMPGFYRFVKRVVAVSTGIGERLHRMGIPFERIKVIPNPVDLSLWGTFTRDRDSLDAKWLEFSPFLLGVGRLHQQKGFDRLIAAFAQLGKDDLNLVILGEGGERKNLEAQVKHLGLEGKVLLPGMVKNPAAAYRLARCFVLSSRYEGWGLVLSEAMACGCPVISFACDYGPNEVVENGVSGLLVEPGDVDGLAEAINLVVENDDLRERLRLGGLLRAKEFDLERIAPKWLEEH